MQWLKNIWMRLLNWLKGTSMPDYIGDEKDNPILKYIQAQVLLSSTGPTSLEIPHLRDAYKLWNAGKQGVVPFLTNQDAQAWFGHSLFTANVRMCLAYEKIIEINHYYSSNSPTAPQIPSNTAFSASYEAGVGHYSGEPLQLKRYDIINSFFGDVAGALDMMSVGLAHLYDFEQTKNCFALSGKPIEPLKVHFSTIADFLYRLKQQGPKPGCTNPTNLIAAYDQEGLLPINANNCQWYKTLKDQRNYLTHVGFPMLYIENGEWKLSADPRGPSPDTNLTDDIPSLCRDIFDDAHRFIGEVYEATWNDLGHHLP